MSGGGSQHPQPLLCRQSQSVEEEEKGKSASPQSEARMRDGQSRSCVLRIFLRPTCPYLSFGYVRRIPINILTDKSPIVPCGMCLVTAMGGNRMRRDCEEWYSGYGSLMNIDIHQCWPLRKQTEPWLDTCYQSLPTCIKTLIQIGYSSSQWVAVFILVREGHGLSGVTL